MKQALGQRLALKFLLPVVLIIVLLQIQLSSKTTYWEAQAEKTQQSQKAGSVLSRVTVWWKAQSLKSLLVG